MFHDTIAEARFAGLQKQFGFKTCIETGTHLGHGALHASRYCDVVTIEINPDFRRQAMENWIKAGCELGLNCYRNGGIGGNRIWSYEGNSPEVLRQWFDTRLDGVSPHRLCFYLDAHWQGYWPLLDELKVVADFGLKDSVIIIHDFKVPNKPFGYDTWNGQALDLDYVWAGLAAINPDFDLAYNEEANVADGNPRGILYATPALF